MASLDERATVLPTARGNVQLAREGQGLPVLVSHGAPGGFDLGLAWCRHLRDGGCEILAPSRPGYLRTPLESGRTPEDQADLYAALLDELDIERATILGFSSGGPSAVHFAARHPNRTNALLLDTAILAPFKPPMNALQRATIESSFLVWLFYQIAVKRPEFVASFSTRGMSEGLNREQERGAVEWITSDPTRLRAIQEMAICTAPTRYRRPGWVNDEVNELTVESLPFADVTARTLIAHGTNDRIVPLEHAANAADAIEGAELMLIEQGHHGLSLSRNYGPVARRQLELAHGR